MNSAMNTLTHSLLNRRRTRRNEDTFSADGVQAAGSLTSQNVQIELRVFGFFLFLHATDTRTSAAS